MPAVVFPRRVITRAMTDGTEDHDTMSEAAYRRAGRARRFCAALAGPRPRLWHPGRVADDLAAGRNVVVNVSRAVLDEARRRFPPVAVVSVTVPPDVLAERLRRRSREAEDDIAGRLARAGAYDVAGPDVVALDNSGSIDTAGAVLAAIITDRCA